MSVLPGVADIITPQRRKTPFDPMCSRRRFVLASDAIDHHSLEVA
jgi:hypothetical protein